MLEPTLKRGREISVNDLNLSTKETPLILLKQLVWMLLNKRLLLNNKPNIGSISQYMAKKYKKL